MGYSRDKLMPLFPPSGEAPLSRERFTGMQDPNLRMRPTDSRWANVEGTPEHGGNFFIDTDSLPDLAANPDPRAHDVLRALGRLGGLS